MAITQGIKHSYDITAAAATAGVGQAPDRRRLYDFSDRIAELSPEESPFFVYLSQTAKVPTSDPIFRVLEDRSKIDWTSRSFYIDGNVNSASAVTVGDSYSFTVDDGSSVSIDWLIKGMVFNVNTVLDTGGYSDVMVRIENTPSIQSADTTFTGKIIGSSNTGVSGTLSIGDNDIAQVIGTAFAEATGAPDTWSGELEDVFGYVQDFKTACELSDWAMATELRGTKNDWNRIWNLKLREHKADIERAMLFSHKKRVSGIQYTEGLVGHILENSTVNVGATDFTYTSGKAYLRSITAAEMTFDRLLSDFEVLYDPARGGSSERLVLCGLPIITMFNKLADGKFFWESMQGAQTKVAPLQWNMKDGVGRFNHKIQTIDTIHGTAHLTKEPMFRGISSKFMLFADMSQLAYRPLVGNGINLDTKITTNVQDGDEALRKDMIRTSAGLEVVIPESHMLYSLEGT